MSVEYVTGDLFDETWGFDAIGHGVNCKGVMGSGIAPLFRNRWPIMYHRYKRICDEDYLLPGMVMPYLVASKGLYVYNIASQYNPGASAKLTYLKAGLDYVHFHMLEKDVKHLGLPRIGAGIGGLSYEDVRATVEEVFAKSSRKVTIVSL